MIRQLEQDVQETFEGAYERDSLEELVRMWKLDPGPGADLLYIKHEEAYIYELINAQVVQRKKEQPV